jgi:adenylate cyclase
LAIARDDDEAWGHWALAGHHLYCGRHDRAIAEYNRAIELNPNDADVLNDFGQCLSYAGRAIEGVQVVRKAMRLNPHHPEYWEMQFGPILFDARQYEEAIATLESLRSLDPILVWLYLAANHAALGHDEQARNAVARVIALTPEATIAQCTTPLMAPYKSPDDMQHFRENLRKAGLPE